MINSMVKSNFGEEKVYFFLWLQSWKEVKAGAQAGKELKQRSWRNTAYQLVFRPTEPAFLYNPGLHAQGGLDPPTLIIYQEKYPTDLPTGPSNGDILLIEDLSSQMTLVYVKLTKI